MERFQRLRDEAESLHPAAATVAGIMGNLFGKDCPEQKKNKKHGAGVGWNPGVYASVCQPVLVGYNLADLSFRA